MVPLSSLSGKLFYRIYRSTFDSTLYLHLPVFVEFVIKLFLCVCLPCNIVALSKIILELIVRRIYTLNQYKSMVRVSFRFVYQNIQVHTQVLLCIEPEHIRIRLQRDNLHVLMCTRVIDPIW